MAQHWFDPDRSGSPGWDLAAVALCVLVFWLPIDSAGRAAWVHAGLIALLVVGMLLRGRRPFVALGVVGAVTLAGAAFGMTLDPFVASAWVLYRVALRYGTARSLNTVVAATGVTIAAVAFLGTADTGSAVRYTMLSLFALASAWVLGATTRRAALEVEHAMLAERRGAVTAERLRVVREVHDVVSHSLGTIAVTAGVAARADDDLPVVAQLRPPSRPIRPGRLVDTEDVLANSARPRPAAGPSPICEARASTPHPCPPARRRRGPDRSSAPPRGPEPLPTE
ncbi:histidine kinase [Nonomuraea sp. NPDC052116]|uniref:histidine kinase n=1 Tax=Nonomuraea sp. NPDC052116 TaxID=3155665 RepID=UPI00343FBAE0